MGKKKSLCYDSWLDELARRCKMPSWAVSTGECRTYNLVLLFGVPAPWRGRHERHPHALCTVRACTSRKRVIPLVDHPVWPFGLDQV